MPKKVFGEFDNVFHEGIPKIWKKLNFHDALFNYVTRDSIANNFVIDVYCRCLEILGQIAFGSIANYFRSYRKKQFGIKYVGI